MLTLGRLRWKVVTEPARPLIPVRAVFVPAIDASSKALEHIPVLTGTGPSGGRCLVAFGNRQDLDACRLQQIDPDVQTVRIDEQSLEVLCLMMGCELVYVEKVIGDTVIAREPLTRMS